MNSKVWIGLVKVGIALIIAIGIAQNPKIPFLQGMIEKDLMDSVYDVTIAYPDSKPKTEMTLVRGEFPSQVDIIINQWI